MKPAECSGLRGIFLTKAPAAIPRFLTVWHSEQRERLGGLLDIPPEVITPEEFQSRATWLEKAEVIFSTWGMPLLSAEQLAFLPRLKAVFHAAGSVKPFAEPLFARGITVVSAAAANAVPVAEFTLSQILFSLKLGWQHHRLLRQIQGPEGWRQLDIPGAYGTTVGIISLGLIGRKLCELLRPIQVKKIACDPFAPDTAFRDLGVQSGTLEEVFRNSNVVTLHAPNLPQTKGMITGALLASMKPNATFINTSRGALVREEELAAVLRSRPDLTALLDVTHPEPPVAGSPLYQLPNVVLTPHMAGSAGGELPRMADLVIDEFVSWKEGRGLRHAVDPGLMARSA